MACDVVIGASGKGIHCATFLVVDDPLSLIWNTSELEVVASCCCNCAHPECLFETERSIGNSVDVISWISLYDHMIPLTYSS